MRGGGERRDGTFFLSFFCAQMCWLLHSLAAFSLIQGTDIGVRVRVHVKVRVRLSALGCIRLVLTRGHLSCVHTCISTCVSSQPELCFNVLQIIACAKDSEGAAHLLLLFQTQLWNVSRI